MLIEKRGNNESMAINLYMDGAMKEITVGMAGKNLSLKEWRPGSLFIES